MLERYLGPDKQKPLGWDELGHGVPTIAALASLAANSFTSDQQPELSELKPEAQTILYAAKDRGVIEIRGSHQAFDSVDRLLSVWVESNQDQRLRFGSKDSPRQRMLFLEGFAQLCASGLVIHHTHCEFSLTTRGFELAESVNYESIAEHLNKAVDPDRTDW